MFRYPIMQILSLADQGKDVSWDVFETKANDEIFLDYLLEEFGDLLVGRSIAGEVEKDELNYIFKEIVGTYTDEKDAQRKYPINNSTLLLIVSMIPDFTPTK
ncbi:hypothetical protein [Vagococcus fluvialis]|uniref:Uncharacterized protein n=1 Tax=Vagococcus fluvialis TaxID=2738 RepID=A0A7X6D6M5_9ENTE|nr:hypothetical protein [Vagococcus fluvialis]NKC66734.1 hypothetical protein [Vagococcus fluvialis]